MAVGLTRLGKEHAMLRIILLVSALLITPFAAFAEESGAVTLEIDGTSYEFPLEASQSDWGGSVTYGSVNIYSKPTDEATWALFKRLTLGFTITNGTTDAPELGLSRMVGGEMQKLFGSKDTGATVTLEDASVDGDFLTLTGSFSGTLGTSKNYGSDIDLSDPVPVTGNFSVTLGPVE